LYLTLEAFSGALFMGGIGLFLFGCLQKWVFPQLQRRYENAKATASQGMNPAIYTEISRVVLLVGLPVLGFYLGNVILTPIFG